MRLVGSLLVMLAAVCFGFMGLFGSWATSNGVTIEMMLFLRFAIAGGLMVLIMFVRRERWPRGALLLGLIGMGGVLYVGEAMFWFHSAQRIPAGVTSLLLYIYPAIVTVFAWLLLKERLTRSRIVALALAGVGLLLTIGPEIEGGETGSDSSQIKLGVVFGLLCCLAYSIYILCGGGLVKRAGAIPAATIVILSAAIVLGAVSLGRGDALPSAPQAWAGIGGLAFFSTFVAITAVLFGLHAIGPVQTSTLSTLEPIVTVLVGWSLMGKPLSPIQVVGGGLIVVAAIIVARSAANEHPMPPLSTDVADVH